MFTPMLIILTKNQHKRRIAPGAGLSLEQQQTKKRNPLLMKTYESIRMRWRIVLMVQCKHFPASFHFQPQQWQTIIIMSITKTMITTVSLNEKTISAVGKIKNNNNKNDDNNKILYYITCAMDKESLSYKSQVNDFPRDENQ